MTDTRISNSNLLIEQQLSKRAVALERKLGTDVVFFEGPLIQGIDRYLRDAVEKVTDRKLKLCVILETPGGYIEVVQRIVELFRYHYSLVCFIVPNIAYSAGTVLVMSGDEIYMDYFSRLGPIDPQVEMDGKLVPALGYLIQYDRLIKKSQDRNLTTAELTYLVQNFNPALLYKYEQARELSITLLKEWLVNYKFKNWDKTETRKKPVTIRMKKARANSIAKKLNKTEYWHTHSRGISIETLRDELDLKILDFGDDPSLKEHIRGYFDLLQDYMVRRGHLAVVHSKHIYLPIIF